MKTEDLILVIAVIAFLAWRLKWFENTTALFSKFSPTSGTGTDWNKNKGLIINIALGLLALLAGYKAFQSERIQKFWVEFTKDPDFWLYILAGLLILWLVKKFVGWLATWVGLLGIVFIFWLGAWGIGKDVPILGQRTPAGGDAGKKEIRNKYETPAYSVNLADFANTGFRIVADREIRYTIPGYPGETFLYCPGDENRNDKWSPAAKIKTFADYNFSFWDPKDPANGKIEFLILKQ